MFSEFHHKGHRVVSRSGTVDILTQARVFQGGEILEPAVDSDGTGRQGQPVRGTLAATVCPRAVHLTAQNCFRVHRKTKQSTTDTEKLTFQRLRKYFVDHLIFVFNGKSNFNRTIISNIENLV